MLHNSEEAAARPRLSAPKSPFHMKIDSQLLEYRSSFEEARNLYEERQQNLINYLIAKNKDYAYEIFCLKKQLSTSMARIEENQTRERDEDNGNTEEAQLLAVLRNLKG